MFAIGNELAHAVNLSLGTGKFELSLLMRTFIGLFEYLLCALADDLMLRRYSCELSSNITGDFLKAADFVHILAQFLDAWRSVRRGFEYLPIKIDLCNCFL